MSTQPLSIGSLVASSTPKPSPVVFRTLETDDFDEFAHTMPGWDAALIQYESSSSTSSVRFAQVGPFQLSLNGFGCRLQIRGQAPAGCYVLNPVISRNAGAIWRGHRFNPGTLNIKRPGEAVDHRTCTNYESISFVIEAAYLERLVRTHCGFELAHYIGQRSAVSIDHEQCQAIHNGLRTTLKRLDNLADLSTIGPRFQAHLARSLAHILQKLPLSRPLDPLPRGYSRRLELSRKVEEYMRSYLHQPITLPRLCEEFDVSARTLAYAFTEATGLPPKAYLKTLRLNQVRHELKKTDPSQRTILQIASRWGLDHSGAFAASYRRLFGELPSHTLKNARVTG